ncbi:hypothetical protein M405DRAFT_855412 [Rhizopogon salebrosus TDB-379]|nr:hypothetical protein M405DRAFT_855412 [Rhizopogon salebrosus TDB-379]
MTHESEALALETIEERIRKDLEDDRKDAECELCHYGDAAGLMHETAERTMHIVHFWELCRIYQQKEHIFPLLFHVATDVLPAQA